MLKSTGVYVLLGTLAVEFVVPTSASSGGASGDSLNTNTAVTVVAPVTLSVIVLGLFLYIRRNNSKYF